MKAILNFFKSTKVRLWSICMLVVVIVSFSIMSVIMITNKIVFTKSFLIDLHSVDTITIANNNDGLSGQRQLNNNKIGGKVDPVIPQNEAKAVETILSHLDKGRKTNSFTQFFTGGESGTERVDNAYTSNSVFLEASGGVYVTIIFIKPTHVIDYIDKVNRKFFQIEEYNPNYERPKNEEGISYGSPVSDYKSRVIKAIHIPLGKVSNKVESQTWYLSTGESNSTTLNYTFTTYGNYYNLFKYINELDDIAIF